MSAADEQFIAKAASLHRAAPREWAEFMTEMKVHTDRCRDDLVRAPQNVISMAQGRAQEAHYLCEMFSNAAKTADRITARRN